MPLRCCSVQRLQERRGQIQEGRTRDMEPSSHVMDITCSHLGLDDVIICSKALGSFHLKQCEGHGAYTNYGTLRSEKSLKENLNDYTNYFFLFLVLFAI